MRSLDYEAFLNLNRESFETTMKNYLNIKVLVKTAIITMLSVAIIKPFNCNAQSNTLLDSDPQKLARGIGHFERARSLLLASIREFDSGYKYVKTDQVLDADVWRKTLLDRAKELETILSPQAREIKSGSAYQPNSGLLGPKVVPPRNIKENSALKPEIKASPEAKAGAGQTKHKEEIESELNGS